MGNNNSNNRNGNFSGMDLISNDWDFDKDPNAEEEIDPVYLYDALKPSKTAYYSANIDRTNSDYMSEFSSGTEFRQRTLNSSDYDSIKSVHRESFLKSIQDGKEIDPSTGKPMSSGITSINSAFDNQALNSYYDSNPELQIDPSLTRRTTPLFADLGSNNVSAPEYVAGSYASNGVGHSNVTTGGSGYDSDYGYGSSGYGNSGYGYGSAGYGNSGYGSSGFASYGSADFKGGSSNLGSSSYGSSGFGGSDFGGSRLGSSGLGSSGLGSGTGSSNESTPFYGQNIDDLSKYASQSTVKRNANIISGYDPMDYVLQNMPSDAEKKTDLADEKGVTEETAPAVEEPVFAAEEPITSADEVEEIEEIVENTEAESGETAQAETEPAAEEVFDDIEDTESGAEEAPVEESVKETVGVEEIPTAEAPATEAPVTEAPATEAPVTEAPAEEASVTEAPVEQLKETTEEVTEDIIEETVETEETEETVETLSVEETAEVEETVSVEETAEAEETVSVEETAKAEETAKVEETAKAEETVEEKTAPADENDNKDKSLSQEFEKLGAELVDAFKSAFSDFMGSGFAGGFRPDKKDDSSNQNVTKASAEGGETEEKDGDSDDKDAKSSKHSFSGSYTDGYEDVCFVCRRSESKVGKMFHLPNHISVCTDCMQRTMETVGQYDYQGMLGGGFSAEELQKEIDKMTGGKGFPNFSFINLANLQGDGGIPNKQKLKRKNKEQAKAAPVIDIKKIPAPHKIREKLDEYVVGQDHAKKIMSVAVYNHYKRVACDVNDDIEIEKSNMLMIGPTGSGKTYLVKTLAKLLDVPLAIADATSLTEAGYIGDDIESVVSKLLAAADNDVERAERGIIFIDEIDKIAKKANTNARDVSGESVQQGMLKLLEGAEIEVPVGASSKGAMVPLATIDTKNILFICGGAFPDLEDIIKERLAKSSSIGFGATLKDVFDKDKEILSKVKIEDIRKFGMIPEFIGRLPIIFTLQGVTKDMLVRILNEPKNAILKQYKKLLALDEVKLEFSDDALEAIAEKALEQDTGARALRSIIEDFMLDIMYEIPKDENIGTVTITGDYIRGTGGPIIGFRGADEVTNEPASVSEAVNATEEAEAENKAEAEDKVEAEAEDKAEAEAENKAEAENNSEEI